jgi:hypothetical protein
MTKPDDIPQDVWDAATACARSFDPLFGRHWNGVDSQDARGAPILERSVLVARAILAERQRLTGVSLDAAKAAIAGATADERDRIAEWADAVADHHDAEAVAANDEAGLLEHRAAERSLRSFAAAIRKGAQ